MECNLQIPPLTLFDTAGNRGILFPNIRCPLDTESESCFLMLEEGENFALYTETGDSILMTCNP